MKRAIAISLAVVISLFLTGAAYAMRGGHGMGYGTGINVETMMKLHEETWSLRGEIITKTLELQGEYNKPTRDTNRIATVQKEIIDLKAKIQEIAKKYGIKVQAKQGMMGHGKMGKGKMRGMGNCRMMR